MATRLTPEKPVGGKRAVKRAPARKPVANGPAKSTGAEHGESELRSTLSPSQTATAIWGRIVKPDRADLTPEAARAILKLDFDPEDHRRVDELSIKAQKGTLTPQEGAELDEYIRVASEVAVLQSKARLSLKRAKPSP